MSISTGDIWDQSLREAVRQSLEDGRITYGEVVYMIRSTFDYQSVSEHEQEDLQKIADSGAVSTSAANLIRSFLRSVARQPRDRAGGSKLFEYYLYRARGGRPRGNPTADQLITAFLAQEGAGAFPHVTRDEVGWGLWINTRMPGLINQGL